MGAMSKLTLKYIKENKIRTSVSVIGLALSISLISIILISFRVFISSAKEDALKFGGDTDVTLYGVKADDIDKIRAYKTVSDIAKFSDDRFFIRERMTEEGSLNYDIVNFISGDSEYFKRVFQKDLIAGRLPQADDEVLVSYTLNKLTNGAFTMGESISVGVNTHPGLTRKLGNLQPKDVQGAESLVKGFLSKSDSRLDLKIVGIYADDPTYNDNYFNDEKGSKLKTHTLQVFRFQEDIKDNLNLEIALSDHSDTKGIKDYLRTFVAEDEDLYLNEYLISTEKLSLLNADREIVVSILVLIAIVTLAISIFIYNIFYTNYADRLADIALLKTLGLTNRQSHKVIFYDCMFYCLTAIPFGYLIGHYATKLIIGIVNRILNNSLMGYGQSFGFSSDIYIFFTTMLIGAIIVFTTNILSAHKVLGLIKKGGIGLRHIDDNVRASRRKYSFVRNTFGYDGFLALRNISTYMGRHWVNVFSITMSIVLFVSISYYIELSENTGVLDNFSGTSRPYVETNQSFERNVINDLTAIEALQVDESVGMVYFTSVISDSKTMPVKAIIMDDEDFKRYFPNIAVTKMEIVGFKSDLPYPYENKIYKFMSLNDVDDLDEPDKRWTTELKDKIYDMDLNIIEKNYYDKLPLKYKELYENGKNEATFFISKSQMRHFDRINADARSRVYISQSGINENLQNDIKYLTFKYNDLYIYSNQYPEITVIKMYMYGFITLISIICILNIGNTGYSSVRSKVREYALLRVVGATRKDIKKVIIFESVIMVLDSTAWSLLLTWVITRLIFSYESNLYQVYMTSYSFPVVNFIISILVLTLLTHLSTVSSFVTFNKMDLSKVLTDHR